MIKALSASIQNLLSRVMGFQESGEIIVDSVSLETREGMRDLGVL